MSRQSKSSSRRDVDKNADDEETTPWHMDEVEAQMASTVREQIEPALRSLLDQLIRRGVRQDTIRTIFKGAIASAGGANRNCRLDYDVTLRFQSVPGPPESPQERPPVAPESDRSALDAENAATYNGEDVE